MPSHETLSELVRATNRCSCLVQYLQLFEKQTSRVSDISEPREEGDWRIDDANLREQRERSAEVRPTASEVQKHWKSHTVLSSEW